MKKSKAFKLSIPLVCTFFALLCQVSILFGLGLLFKPPEQIPNKNNLLAIRLFSPKPSIKPAPPLQATQQTQSIAAEKVFKMFRHDKKQAIEILKTTRPRLKEIEADKPAGLPEELKPEPAKKTKKKIVKPAKKTMKPVTRKIKKTVKSRPEPEKNLNEVDAKPVTGNKKAILTENSQPTEKIINKNIEDEDSVRAQTENTVMPIKADIADFSAYLAKVHSLIAKNQTYPSRARRRNIQGQVNLTFSISSTGKAQNLKIVNKADKLLINAAKKLIQKTSFPPPPEGWQESFEVELPVVYRFR